MMMCKLRILIIAHDFPPLNSSASHRPYSWARTWADLGHDIHVLTTAKYGHDGRVDLAQDLAGIRVHSVHYLHGVTPIDAAGPGRAAPTARGLEAIRRATRRIRAGFGPFAQFQVFAYRPLVRAGLALIAKEGFNLIVSTSGPEVCPMVANRLASKTGVPWLSDYRDLWHPEFAVSRWPVTNMLVSLLNRWMLRRPSAVSTVSEGLAGYLRKLVHCKVWVCYNGFLEVNTSKLPPAPRPDGKVHLVYTGNFYRGKRDPAPLLDALGALKAVNREAARRLRVDFYGPAEAWVRRLVSERGLDDLVLLHGNVSYGESIARQRAADMLLFVDWMDTRAQGVLTGKLFEYLASGRPILSVGKHRETEAARLIVACKAGMVATTIAETQDALFTLVSGSFSTMHDWEKIRTFSRRAQATALLDEIEKYFKGAAQ